ncbi:MAG TPA: DUF551 domain-containing protein [Chthoniobacterales bacterium]
MSVEDETWDRDLREKKTLERQPHPSIWTACKDSLPEFGQIVWLYDARGKVGPWIGSRDVEDERWLWSRSYGEPWHDGKKWDADTCQDDDYQVTHWMPLPDLSQLPKYPEQAV